MSCFIVTLRPCGHCFGETGALLVVAQPREILSNRLFELSAAVSEIVLRLADGATSCGAPVVNVELCTIRNIVNVLESYSTVWVNLLRIFSYFITYIIFLE